MSKRGKFSPEFKCEAVALTRQPGVSCRQIALDVGINSNLLSRWRCSGSMIPDTNVGGNIAAISEVSDDQETTIFYAGVQAGSRLSGA